MYTRTCRDDEKTHHSIAEDGSIRGLLIIGNLFKLYVTIQYHYSLSRKNNIVIKPLIVYTECVTTISMQLFFINKTSNITIK